MLKFLPQIKKLTTKEMLKKYESVTGRAINRFSSRAAGELQLARAMERAENKLKGKRKMNTTGAAADQAKRSEGTKRSWQDEQINFLRRQRNGVAVEGKGEFRSVKAAFEELELDLKKHIKFRIALKREGELEFEGYKFKII